MYEQIVVTLNDGKIRGTKESSPYFDIEFFSFYGVPYAKPPLGELRFKDPVKVTPWKGIREVVHKREGCLQFSLNHFRLMGSEDCLYVNVHIPSLPQCNESKKAVIVFIHLGGHHWGSPDPIHHGSPNYIMQNDIVYVTIGYRLNIFGFLNLNLPECSGNQGIKDIIMAFQWIKENIHLFNGDPTNITALGTSSGAELLHLLMLSPAAKGLFHKAILMGQYMFNSLVPYHTNHLEMALEFAYQLGFKGNDPKKLLTFFKNKHGYEFVLEMKKFRKKLNSNKCKAFEGGLFVFSIDDKILPVSPLQLIDSTTRIPTIFGICDKEATLAFIHRKTLSRTYYRQSLWGWTYNLDNNQLKQMNKQIESFYFENTNEKPLSVKIDILSDAAFSDVYDTLINVISKYLPSSVYVYKFQHVGELGYIRNTFSSSFDEPVEGSFHSDDVYYWAAHSSTTPTTMRTKRTIATFTKLFTTFAKTGNPNYDGIETHWKPTTPETPCYLEINNKLSMIDGKLNGKRFEFWDSLKKQFKHD